MKPKFVYWHCFRQAAIKPVLVAVVNPAFAKRLSALSVNPDHVVRRLLESGIL